MFIIVDSGSCHRGKKAARQLRDAYPNAIMIHAQVYASRLNQAGIVFSIVKKKVISPNDFTSTAQLAATLVAFLGRYKQTRPAVQLEVHRYWPDRAPPAAQRPPRTRQPAKGCLTVPDELTE